MYLIIILLPLILLYFLNIHPLLIKRFIKEKLFSFTNINEIGTLIVNTSLGMLQSEKVFMSFNDEMDLYIRLAKFKDTISGNEKYKSYTYYNFPRAWLMIGLLDEYESKKDNRIIIIIETQCNKLIDTGGKLLFTFNKADQALFGLVFIRLFKITSVEKYSIAAVEIYKKLEEFTTTEKIILYRMGTNICFVDTLGMVCPFLYIYGAHFKNLEAIQLANVQLDNYLKNGRDEKSNLPFHAIDMDNNIRIGSINWARGLGWFMIGLAYAIRFNKKVDFPDSFYKTEFDKIQELLNKLKVNNNYWSQFLGHTNDSTIDSSATLMFYYARQVVSQISISEEDIFLSIKSSVDRKGFVINSTGDTIYINKYSRVKGKSEVSQGLLVSILSKLIQ